MPTRLIITSHGPIRIEGPVIIQDREGNPYDLTGRRKVALCRCGESGHKPFCDASHARCGAWDEAAARDLPPRKPGAPGPEDNPPPFAVITVNPNGGLRIQGSFTIEDEAGSIYGLDGRPSVSLCRCGASKGRPFCDGTHNTTGFISER
ncbi:MAG: CDGSH iron-sulfur domain-containing protein [Gemmatimonadales bacterium]